MLTPAKYALQSISKQRFRSVVIFLLVFITSVCLYSVSYFIRNIRSGVEQAAGYVNADIIVVPSGYSESAKSSLFEGEACTILFDADPTEKLRGIAGIDKVSRQLFLETLQMDCCSASGVQIIAIDTANDFAVGRNLSSMGIDSLAPDELIAGSGCGLATGSTINFFNRDFTVAAVLDETGMGYDQSAFVSLEAADAITADEQYKHIFGERTGISSMILIKTAGGADIDAVKSGINSALSSSGAAAYTVEGMTKELLKELGYFRSFGTVISTFVVLLASVALFSVITLSFHQRRSRVGSLLSVGISRGKIVEIFALEYLYLTLFAALSGIALAMMVVLPLHDVIKRSLELPYKFIGAGNMALLGAFVLGVDIIMLALGFSVTFAGVMRTEPARLQEEQL
jgi:putative ABC transport system permease protein